MNKSAFTLVLACIGLLVALPFSARADVTYSGNRDELEVVTLTVTPAAAPVPSLKYRLLARDIDLVSGNATPFYYRAIMEEKAKMEQVSKEYGEELDNWFTTGEEATPLAKLPLDKVRKANQDLDWIVREHVVAATSRRDCDWQLGIENARGLDIISFLLPEFQEMRQLSRILALRTRLAIAEKRYADAIDTMRMNYRLAVDTAKPPFLVCGLIGIAEVSVANGTLVELLAAPDSPNMYWGLTELPQPLIDLRVAARFELGFGPRFFPLIDHSETTVRSPEEWNRLFKQAFQDFSRVTGNQPANGDATESALLATGVALAGYPHAKASLIAQGMDREQVEKMAVGQVIAIYTERQCERLANDYERLWYVPFWELRKHEQAINAELEAVDIRNGGENREVLPIVSQLLPAIQACRNAQVRMERDMAALRVIEALRMYAAEHAGKLPESLEDITQVPIPLNPATGKAFLYRLEDKTGVLDLPKSDRVTGSNRRFEIQIAAKK